MTKHLDSLKIQNFRMLEDFEVAKLGQVNLIVGKNNSGKSTVLEALRIYAGNAHIEILKDILKARGEAYDFLAEEYLDIENSTNPFISLISNRIQSHRWSFSISDLTHHKKVLFLYSTPSKNPPESEVIIATALQTLKNFQLYYNEPIRFFCIIKNQVNYKIFWKNETHLNTWLSSSDGSFLPLPLSFIDTQIMKINDLAKLWDNIVFTELEKIVLDILHIIEPQIQGLNFINDKYKTDGQRTGMVRLANHDKPIPLKSLGEGIQRILTIALNIPNAKDGFLLIDEFENGLHYSVQEKVWNLIFEMAKRLNIQVFATTHSWDCIEAFSKVAKEREDVEGLLFRMGRSAKTSDKGKVIATIFDEDKLQRFTQADMEVR